MDNLTASFQLMRDLCLRAKTASPHDAMTYLEFITSLSEQSMEDLRAQVMNSNRSELAGDLEALETDLATMRTAMARLKAALTDLINGGEEPVANPQ